VRLISVFDSVQIGLLAGFALVRFVLALVRFVLVRFILTLVRFGLVRFLFVFGSVSFVRQRACHPVSPCCLTVGANVGCRGCAA
jgi:hypothetical protein